MGSNLSIISFDFFSTLLYFPFLQSYNKHKSNENVNTIAAITIPTIGPAYITNLSLLFAVCRLVLLLRSLEFFYENEALPVAFGLYKAVFGIEFEKV